MMLVSELGLILGIIALIINYKGYKNTKILDELRIFGFGLSIIAIGWNLILI